MPNGCTLKMILRKQWNWLKISGLIQIMLNQVLAMKFFNNLDKLINDIKNKETKRKNTIEKIRNIVSDLDQQRQKEKIVFQNKMIDFVYYLFNT